MANFGTAVSWVADMSAEGRAVTGFRVVAEAIARRWMTPRGRLIGYPDYGYDLTQFVNADMSQRDIVALQAGAAAEAEKDSRVVKCDVTATLGSDGLLTVTATVDTAAGPFDLVASVSDITLELLSVSS
jgi:hypothetical protein